MTRILIIGLTGGGEIGRYETQLGNVAISIPMMKLLKDYIPDAKISTTTQFTDSFCATYGINRISAPKKLLPRFNVQLRLLIFNGDVFPGNISPKSCITVLIHVVEILTIRQLGVPIIEFASSPGPFNTLFKRIISKIKFSNISVFTNREPISSELLKQIRIKTPIVNTACPAFLLEPASEGRAKEILEKENVYLNDRPLIGITICAHNLTLRHTQGRHKNFDSLSLFVPMLKYILDHLNANVILLPHVYEKNPHTNTYTYTYDLIYGTDYEISLNLFKMLDGDKYKGRLRLIEGKYTASEVKSLIGQCDMYISGRLHAGIAALSQGVPTVLVSYGHKHHGIARLLRQEKYVYTGENAEELRSHVKYAWDNRVEIAKVLHERLPRIKKLVHLNFEIVKEIVDLKKEQRNHMPKEISDMWIKRGE
jgi:colanic acid/amylovoran biosynthesis protein